MTEKLIFKSFQIFSFEFVSGLWVILTHEYDSVYRTVALDVCLKQLSNI